MKFAYLILIFIVAFSDLLYRSTAGNCDGINYITIQDPRRSAAYVIGNRTSRDKVLCDRVIIKDDVWYRFSSEVGGEMPTTAPDFHSCGTYGPIWMNGTHPTFEEGKVKRRACVKIPYGHPSSCGESYDIRVRNCSGYYIYQLKEPTHCDFAYCAGSKVPNCTNADPNTDCPANAPPYFKMPSNFYAIANSPLQVPIIAIDPEALPLKYSVLSNGTIKKTSIDLQNRLTILTNESDSVYLKIVDDADAQSFLTLQVTVVQCPCQNEGKCLWGELSSPYSVSRPNYTCSCTEQFAGKLCEYNCPCKNGGKCRWSALSPVNRPSYTCSCGKHFTGELCEYNSDPVCQTLPCFPGLKCTVTTEGYHCEKCPEKFEGDGRNCNLKTQSGTISFEAEISVVAGLKWTDELKNKSSLYYKNVTAQVTIEIKEVYARVPEFVYVVITGYRQGSVVVEFRLILKKRMEDPLKPLKKCTRENGKLGSLTVDQDKLKEKTKSTKDKTYFEVHKTVFITVITLVSLLALTAIIGVGICMRKKKMSIVVLSVGSDDRAEICPNSGRNSRTEVKRPSHNQVVDLATVDNKVFVGAQYNKC